jgi:hypothetical protein
LSELSEVRDADLNTTFCRLTGIGSSSWEGNWNVETSTVSNGVLMSVELLFETMRPNAFPGPRSVDLKVAREADLSFVKVLLSAPLAFFVDDIEGRSWS